jgi:hypothetical protein
MEDTPSDYGSDLIDQNLWVRCIIPVIQSCLMLGKF